MLGKMGKKNRSVLDFSDDEIELIVGKLIGDIRFRALIDGMIDGKFDSPGFKRSVTAKVKSVADKQDAEPIIVRVGESDLLVVPSEGISGDQVEKLVSIMPKDKFLGVIVADGVKVIKMT